MQFQILRQQLLFVGPEYFLQQLSVANEDYMVMVSVLCMSYFAAWTLDSKYAEKCFITESVIDWLAGWKHGTAMLALDNTINWIVREYTSYFINNKRFSLKT